MEAISDHCPIESDHVGTCWAKIHCHKDANKCNTVTVPSHDDVLSSKHRQITKSFPLPMQMYFKLIRSVACSQGPFFAGDWWFLKYNKRLILTGYPCNFELHQLLSI